MTQNVLASAVILSSTNLFTPD